MIARTFNIDSYLSPSEAFHFARKTLASGGFPEPHTHDYFELFLIERGAARHLINGREERLPRGALVFLRPSDCHALSASADEGCRLINIMFRIETARHLAHRYGSELGPRYFWSAASAPETHILTGPRIERAVNSTLELQSTHRGLARIEQFLLYLMTRVVDYASALPDDAPRWLASAVAATRTPDVFRKGAAGFVEVAGRGHEHVCRTTRAHLGMSPSAYVNRVRMEYAAMQLGATDLSVEEIASACGIENLSHFYRLFRDQYGHTPRAYRRQHRDDPVQS